MQQRLSPTDSTDSTDSARSSAPSSPRVGLRWAAHTALVLGALLASASLGATACGSNVQPGGTTSSSSSGAGGAGDCIGGIIINGQCEGKCTPDKCLPGNTCVGNACLLKCTSHNDCYTGIQDCVPAKEDDTNADITVCKSNGLAPVGAPCPFGDECGKNYAGACPDGKACDYIQCDGGECTKDPSACGDDPSCTLGLCPDMATRCTVPACSKDQCKPLTCRTTGSGDADAFCTLSDCTDDKECPGGFYCAIVHDPHQICGTMKGNSNFCGKTAEPCVDLTKLDAGSTYFEGSVCLLHKMCLKRMDCTPCATDLDCSDKPGQRCIGTGSDGMDKRCASDCKTDKDCGPSYHCPNGSCVPRFVGGCKGTGKFCEPCQNDEDCGMKGTSVACVADDLSGERACLDLSFPNMCAVDADCPQAPGGKHGHCFTENDGVMPGDQLYHRCYLPYNANTNKYSCW